MCVCWGEAIYMYTHTCIHVYIFLYTHIKIISMYAVLYWEKKIYIYIYTNNGEYNWDLNGRQQVDDGTAM